MTSTLPTSTARTDPSDGPTPTRPAARRAKALAWAKEAAIMVGVSGAVLLGVSALKGKGGSGAAAVAERAPAFRVARADGSGSVSSDELRGKPVVLTFWATWCPACRDELPELEKLARTMGADAAIVPVSRESAATVMTFAERRGIAMPLYVGQGAFDTYRVESIPTTLVIDAHGEILAEKIGGVDADELEELVRRGGDSGGGGTTFR